MNYTKKQSTGTKLKLMKINQISLVIITCLFSTVGFSQPSQNNPNNQFKLDGVAAVVGDEVILDSDIERYYVDARAQGLQVEDRCDFLENILVDKLLLSKAREDTLVYVTNEQVDRQVEGTIQRFLTQGSEQEILDFFGFNTMAEFKQDLFGLVRDQALSGEEQKRVTQNTDATPEEVRAFYEKYKDELPDSPDEVGLSHIVIYPDISPENEQKVIDELKTFKKEVEEGSSFSTKAILYSEDPGSASAGGLIKNVKRGQMVPEFDAVVFNLQEGEISEPFKTDFGYHIAMLDKRRGQELDIRHILIRLKPTADEIAKSKQKMDSIIRKIDQGEITFKEAVFNFSIDKYTKFNAGKLSDPQTGEDRLNRATLPPTMLSAITNLEVGDISAPYEDEFNAQTVIRAVRLDEVIPTHKIDLETDYSRLKNLTINTKKQETLMKWVKEQITDTFINIGKDYDNCQFRMNWRKE